MSKRSESIARMESQSPPEFSVAVGTDASGADVVVVTMGGGGVSMRMNFGVEDVKGAIGLLVAGLNAIDKGGGGWALERRAEAKEACDHFYQWDSCSLSYKCIKCGAAMPALK